MHVVFMLTSNNNDEAMRRWVPCSLLNNIADSNGTLLLPMIYLMRAGGGGEGEGGCG